MADVGEPACRTLGFADHLGPGRTGDHRDETVEIVDDDRADGGPVGRDIVVGSGDEEEIADGGEFGPLEGEPQIGRCADERLVQR